MLDDGDVPAPNQRSFGSEWAGGAEIRGCECVLLVLILEGAAPFGFKGAGFVWSSKSLLPRSFLALSPSTVCSPFPA
jgi:hypothetical protein